MIFRKKYASDKKPTNIRTYESFFSKKVINTQNFITNETSLKMKEEVSWKYHKLARSIMISCLYRKKNAL